MPKKKQPINKFRKAFTKYYSKAKEFLIKKRSAKVIAQKIWTFIKGWYIQGQEALLKLLFERYYGIKLLRPKTVLISYIILLVALYAGLTVLPRSFIETLGYVNFTEQVLTILVVLLTVLLSAGLVLLGDDTRGWSLARMTIIRDVVRLRGLMIACILIALISITPDYSLGGYSLKALLSPVLIASFIFILGIYARIYLWLSDLAADPSFFDPQDPDDPDKKRDDRVYIGGSYRFARIVHLIHYLDARDAWQAVLEKKIPYGYEELLHEEFFDGIEKIIKSKKEAMYMDLSIRLEIYDKYYKRRNLESWRFYLDYIKRFLLMYSAISKIIEADRKVRMKGLWRGERALKNINEKLISDSMTNDGSWSSFEAMDAYLIDRGLLYLGDRQNIQEDGLVKHFINVYLENTFKEKLDHYHIESYFTEHKHWQITYANLFEERFNITYAFEKIFKEWLFKELFVLKEKEGFYEVDSLFETHFTEVDPVTIADFYWLLYQAQNTTESELIINLYYSNPRPFGLMGRSYISDWSDDREAERKEFIRFQNEQIDNAVKLFASRYNVYFLRFWKLDELIEISRSTVEVDDLNEKEKYRVEHLHQLLKKVKAYYESGE